MKDSQLYIVCAAVYLAPHLSTSAGIASSVWLACYAVYCGRKKS